MAIEVRKTAHAVEIFHTEHKLGKFITAVALPAYVWAAVYFWSYFLRKHGSFSYLNEGDQIKLIVLEITFATCAVGTIFFCTYITSPLTLRDDGTVIRKFLGLTKSIHIGTPYVFEVTTYKHRSDSLIRYPLMHDLYLVGPVNSVMVTARGDPKEFSRFAGLAKIPIRDAPKDL